MRSGARLVKILVVIALVQLAARHRQQESTMNSSPKPAAKSTRTVCVGRYTVDVPRSATDFQIGQKINGIRIDVQYPSNSSLLRRKIESDAPIGASSVAASLNAPPDNLPAGAVFQLSEDGQGLHTVRDYILKKDASYLFTVPVLSDSVAGAKVAIAKLMNSIRPREPFEIPAESGICIDHGFIPGDRESGESVTLVASLPDFKSRFGVTTDSGGRGTDQNIISRMSSLPTPLANFVSSTSTILRSDSRQIAGRKGDEYDLIDKSANTASFE